MRPLLRCTPLLFLFFLLLLLHSRASSAAQAAATASGPSYLLSTFSWLRRLTSSNLPASLLIFALFSTTKHALCIPGGTAFNAAAGALFGFPLALPLCLLCAVAGSSLCYLLSRTCGAPLLSRWRLDARVAPLRRRAEAAAARGQLFRHLLSLRLVPLVPQWLINLASPHIGVPLLPTFVGASLLGFAPYIALTVSAGAALAGAAEGGLDAAALPPPRALLLLAGAGAAVALGPWAAARAGCGDACGGGGGSSGGGEGGGAHAPGAQSPLRPSTPVLDP
jgi:uncharacterized membrane protein YdjX (TVP38/TMEM64 family)